MLASGPARSAVTLLIHPLTIAECIVGPARSGQLEVAQSAMQRLGIGVLDEQQTVDAAARLAKLRAETGLRMPDSCVLDAAELLSASIATFDQHMAKIAESRGVSLA